MGLGIEYGTSSATVHCAWCGVGMPVYDPEHSEYFACHNCGYISKNENGSQVTIVGQCEIVERLEPVLPIGSVGTLIGIKFIVVGFARKKDSEGEAEWMEYYLRNHKRQNYHVLVEYNGHWMLVWKKNLSEFRLGDSSGVLGGGQQYLSADIPPRIFKHTVNYTFGIYWAAGEFDWNFLREVHKLQVDEYVCPPNIIVREQMDGTTDLYWGVLIDGTELRSGFSIDASRLPRRIGYGPLEVKPYEASSNALARFTFLMVLLVILTPFVISGFKTPKTVFTDEFETTQDSTWATAKPIVTPTFKITQRGAVNVDLLADVDNDWMEVDLVLVNDNTGKSYEANRALEYYHGYEDGESWSEGTKDPNLVFSGVPEGLYHFNIYPAVEAGKVHRLRITVEQATTMVSNMFMMLLAVFAYPAYRYFQRQVRQSLPR